MFTKSEAKNKTGKSMLYFIPCSTNQPVFIMQNQMQQTQHNFKTMTFNPARARSCVCFLSKNDYLHIFKTGEDAIGNKWRAIADEFGAVVYVEIKPTKRLHREAFERS